MQHFLVYLCVANILLTSTSTSTSALFLRSKPLVSYYQYSSSSTSIFFTSIDSSTMGFFSFQKSKNFHYKQRCYLTAASNDSESSSEDGGDSIREGEGMTVSETYDNMQRKFFVYYTVSIDRRQSRITKVKVNEGDDIDSIIDEIKRVNSPDFDDVPGYRIELFESIKQDEPLNALETWNTRVTWGTKVQPLMVKVNPLITRVAALSPWENSAADHPNELKKANCLSNQ